MATTEKETWWKNEKVLVVKTKIECYRNVEKKYENIDDFEKYKLAQWKATNIIQRFYVEEHGKLYSYLGNKEEEKSIHEISRQWVKESRDPNKF